MSTMNDWLRECYSESLRTAKTPEEREFYTEMLKGRPQQVELFEAAELPQTTPRPEDQAGVSAADAERVATWLESLGDTTTARAIRRHLAARPKAKPEGLEESRLDAAVTSLRNRGPHRSAREQIEADIRENGTPVQQDTLVRLDAALKEWRSWGS